MSMSPPLISIIIATFNSEKTLPMALASIKKQIFPQEKLEVLVLDGGSTDKTLMIASRFNCRIIENPRTEPIYGKFLGYLSARGRHVMYLDSDEELENRESLEKKMNVFSFDKKIKVVIGSGYKSPRNYPFINHYINEFGDPFTFFTYNLSKDTRFFIKTMKKRYPVAYENRDFVSFNFAGINNLPLIELAAGGSMFDTRFLKINFPKTLEKFELLPHYFYLICKKAPYLAMIKNDALVHYSADTIKKYLIKILWRIKNNIYHVKTMGQSGFLGREKYQPAPFRIKKFLFLPYSYSIVLPLADCLYLSFSRKDFRYFAHFPLCLYTATQILFHFLLKTVGFKPELRSYDESKVVKKFP